MNSSSNLTPNDLATQLKTWFIKNQPTHTRTGAGYQINLKGGGSVVIPASGQSGAGGSGVSSR